MAPNRVVATVVVAPHPDDEVFGAGGVIALKRDRGAAVSVVFLTRGEGSHRSCCAVAEEEVGEARAAMAAEALEKLGLAVTDLHWFDCPDGGIPGSGTAGFDAAAEKLAVFLREKNPAEVFAPFPGESWPDHRAAGEISREAVRRAGGETRLYYYLVWTWIGLPLAAILRLPWRKSLRVDIGEGIDRKGAAVEAYLGKRAPCGFPWSGALPEDFLKAFQWPFEIFFRSDCAIGKVK